MTRRSTLPFFALFCLIATIGDAQVWDHSYAPLTPVADQQGAHPNELTQADDRDLQLREGMKFVNQVGELREAGGRVLFYPDGYTRSLELLENLALERVSDNLDETHRKWSITGVVTEYRGGNYLLLHRAVLKARISPALRPRS